MDGGGYRVGYARSSHARPVLDRVRRARRRAITWSSPEGNSVTSPVPATLTLAQLKAIYLCTDTNRDQAGGPNAPIVAVLPQDCSGTRATFLPALGGGTTPAGAGYVRTLPTTKAKETAPGSGVPIERSPCSFDRPRLDA
jgi:hypothetical protein